MINIKGITRRSFVKGGAVALGAAALGAAGLLTGCSSEGSSSGARNASHEVTDMAGDVTEVPNRLTMIAGIWTPANAVVGLLGQMSKLVATTNEFKESSWVNYVFPEVADVPVVVDEGPCDCEQLVEIDPCVVFANSSQQSDIDTLRMADLRAMNVGFDTIDSMKEAISIIADTIGDNAAEKAQRWSEVFDENTALVEDTLSDVTEAGRLEVLHVVKDEGVLKVVSGGITDEWIRLAGGFNSAAPEDDGKELTTELLDSYSPYFVLVSGSGADFQANNILANPVWSNTPAVQFGNVAPCPVGVSSWSECSPEFPLAALWLASVLYPERFEEIDVADKIRDFYEEFYGFRISKCDAKAIMACEPPDETVECNDDESDASADGGEQSNVQVPEDATNGDELLDSAAKGSGEGDGGAMPEDAVPLEVNEIELTDEDI